MSLRLNKYIAQCGVSSRRKADELIAQGVVYLNKEKVTKLGLMIDPEEDEVTIHGKKLKTTHEKVYYMLNKPRDYICSDTAREGEHIVNELIPDSRVFSVGRLDKNTTGLILFTNDGDLKNSVTHPRGGIEKEYLIKTRNPLTAEQIETLRNGVSIDIEVLRGGVKTTTPYFAKPEKLELVKTSRHGTILLLTIHEGKKRQIRLMMQKVEAGHIELKRVRIGAILLGELETGEYRELTSAEVEALKKEFI